MYMCTAEWNTVSQYCTKIKPCKDPAYNNNNSINWIKVKPRHARYAMSFPTVNAYFVSFQVRDVEECVLAQYKQ